MDLAVLLTEAMSSPPRAASGGRRGVADALLAPPPNAASLHRGQRLSMSIIIIYRAYYDAYWPSPESAPAPDSARGKLRHPLLTNSVGRSQPYSVLGIQRPKADRQRRLSSRSCRHFTPA